MSEFEYILDRINDAEFGDEPFHHIYVKDILSDEHFALITRSDDVNIPNSENTEDLIRSLLKRNYKVIPFPGCTTSVKHYLKCYNSGKWPVDTQRLEGFGLAFRLKQYQNQKIKDLIEFLNGDAFKSAIEQKFDISRDNRIETAIHKYSTGYEISPHPDVRSKCLTYLININPAERTEEQDIHTHLLKFKPEYAYIGEFWKGNQHLDTDWVPWEWCETKKQTNANNSLIMFRPSHDTLHAVRLKYDHLKFQRTQIYGNLWYTDVAMALPPVPYSEFELTPEDRNSLNQRFKKTVTYYRDKVRELTDPWSKSQ
ncbi:MAG: hypothetical protein GKS01_12135 [Alphaproteobacteria bacterium]|nr:hypothetical protein [Alphaproteobacteria bacterium]